MPIIDARKVAERKGREVAEAMFAMIETMEAQGVRPKVFRLTRQQFAQLVIFAPGLERTRRFMGRIPIEVWEDGRRDRR